MQPAKSYEKTYKFMTEGLSLLYYLVEVYEGGAKLAIDQLFKQYGSANGMPPKAAADHFYAHAPFLASRMVKNEEGIRWGHTSFYQHLRKVHPEAFGLPAVAPPPSKPTVTTQPKAAPTRTAPARTTQPPVTQTKSAPPRATVAGASKPPPEPARTAATRSSAREVSSRTRSADPPLPKRATRSTEPPPAAAAPSQAAKKLGRPRKASAKSETKVPLLSEVDKSRAREVWKFMQKKSNDALPDVSEMTIETFGRFLHQEYEFQDEKEAQYFLKYLAPDLAAMMSIPRNRSYDPWTELPVYDELMEAKVPPQIKGRIAAIQLQKRDNPLPGLPEDSEPSDEDSSEESVIDKEEASRRKKEASRRRISALRPKSGSKYSGKAAKRKGKEKLIEPEDEEMLDAEAEEHESEDVMSVDTPSKRKSMSDEDDDEEDEAEAPEYPNKRFTRSRGDVDPELEDLEFAVQQARSTNLPVRRKPSIPQTNGQRTASETRVALISEPAMATDANAPGDIWNCPHAGCVHKVYGASEFSSKELIKEHLIDHKEKDRVDLVKDEENMTQLPVSHLLKRIREMAERAGGEQLRQLEGGMMGLFPPPLERKVH